MFDTFFVEDLYSHFETFLDMLEDVFDVFSNSQSYILINPNMEYISLRRHDLVVRLILGTTFIVDTFVMFE